MDRPPPNFYVVAAPPTQPRRRRSRGVDATVAPPQAYLCVANHFLTNHPVVIDCMNLLGSSCVGYNCYCKKAFPPMALECAWFTIAFAALVRHAS